MTHKWANWYREVVMPLAKQYPDEVFQALDMAYRGDAPVEIAIRSFELGLEAAGAKASKDSGSDDEQ